MNSFLFLDLQNSFCTEEMEKDGFNKFHQESIEAFNRISERTGARIILLDGELPFKVTQGYNPFQPLLLYRDFKDTQAVMGKVMPKIALETKLDDRFEKPECPMGYLIEHWELNHLRKPFKANPQLAPKYEVWEGTDFIKMRENERGVHYRLAIFSTSKDTFKNSLYREHETLLIAGESPKMTVVDAQNIINLLNNEGH